MSSILSRPQCVNQNDKIDKNLSKWNMEETMTTKPDITVKSNGRHDASNHRQLDCLFTSLFRVTNKDQWYGKRFHAMAWRVHDLRRRFDAIMALLTRFVSTRDAHISAFVVTCSESCRVYPIKYTYGFVMIRLLWLHWQLFMWSIGWNWSVPRHNRPWRKQNISITVMMNR